MEQELVLPVLLPLGSLWGQGNPMARLGGFSISCTLLGMQQVSEGSAGPTYALNCRADVKVMMAN